MSLILGKKLFLLELWKTNDRFCVSGNVQILWWWLFVSTCDLDYLLELKTQTCIRIPGVEDAPV